MINFKFYPDKNFLTDNIYPDNLTLIIIFYLYQDKKFLSAFNTECSLQCSKLNGIKLRVHINLYFKHTVHYSDYTVPFHIAHQSYRYLIKNT